MSTTYDQVLSSLRFDKNLSNLTCEVNGCSKCATVQKIVNVGVFGDIHLNLCKNCVSKFSGEIVTTKNSSSYSLPMERKKDVCKEYRVSTA